MLIADQVALLVERPVLVQELKGRAESAVIHKLDDAVQLFELVLQRRPGENHGVWRDEFLHCPGGFRFPIFDPLGLVEHHHVGFPFVQQVQVANHLLVVDQLVEALPGIEFLAGVLQPLDHLHRPVGELANLRFPLVFHTRRCDDQHPVDAPFPGEDLDRGHGLDGLPQPHVVTEDRPAPAGHEHRAAQLVVVQRDLEQRPQRRFLVPRLQFPQQDLFPRGHQRSFVLPPDEIERVRHDRDLLRHRLHGIDQLRVVQSGQREAGLVKKTGRQSGKLIGMPGRQLQSQAKLMGGVIERDLWPGDRRLALPHRVRRILAEFFEHALDVLAGAERVRFEVGTGAGVVPGVKAPDGDGVLPARLRIGDPVVRKDLLAAGVFDHQAGVAGPLSANVDLFFAKHAVR